MRLLQIIFDCFEQPFVSDKKLFFTVDCYFLRFKAGLAAVLVTPERKNISPFAILII